MPKMVHSHNYNLAELFTWRASCSRMHVNFVIRAAVKLRRKKSIQSKQGKTWSDFS